MESRAIIKHVSKITSSTLLSRILGYARDMAIANFFGANWLTDCFYVAYRIPNLLRRLLGEGSLTAAFIPIYTDYLTNKDKEEQKHFLSVVFTFLFITLLFITIIGIILSPAIVKIIAPGFSNVSSQIGLTVLLTRIMFPFFIVIGLAAFTMGVLNSHKLFVYPALAPCFLSISELFWIFVICPFMERPIIGLAFGVVLGGTLQFVFQIPPMLKKGIKFKFSLNYKNKGLRNVLYLMFPATIAMSVNQINSFVDVFCASWLSSGSISALYYSNHIMLLPLALFGIAISTVILPAMSEFKAKNNVDDLKKTLASGIRLMLYTIIPSSIGLIVLARPIVRLLFERGQFGINATQMTSYALVFYSIGIFAYAGTKLLASAFYSLKDTKTPVKIAAVAMILNIELNFIFLSTFKVGGLALATSLASIFNVIFLGYNLRKRIGPFGVLRIIKSFIPIFIASIIMGVLCQYLSGVLYSMRFLSVFVPVVVGFIVYIVLTYVMRVEEAKLFFSTIKGAIYER